MFAHQRIRSRWSAKRLTQRGYGYYLTVIVFLCFMILSLGIASAGRSGLEFRRANLQRNFRQNASMSRTSGIDLGHATKILGQKIGMAAQMYANKGNGKTGSITPDEIEQVCKNAFPNYFQLEMRGTTLDPLLEGDDPNVNYGYWRNLLGRATVIVRYDGILPGAAVGLPDDTTGKRNNWVIALTFTVPYSIERHYTQIPEDYDGTTLLGSAWRPAVPVSIWDGTKNGGKYAPPQNRYGLFDHVPIYHSAGEVKCFIALAVPVDQPPPDLTELPDATACPTGSAQTACTVFDTNNNCSTYTVINCSGSYNVSCATQQDCDRVTDAINRGERNELIQAITKTADNSILINLTLRERTGRDEIAPGLFAPPIQDFAWGKVVPAGIDGTLGGAPIPGVKIPKKVPVGSNLLDAQIMFTPWSPLAPGKYIVSN